MGIVHRDISAGNVMVSLQGEVKLSDFGIVKSNRRVSKTQVGMVKGNANFMSPEQARGQAVDRAQRSLLAGARPLLRADGRAALLRRERSRRALPGRRAASRRPTWPASGPCPSPAAGVLEKALAFEPAERFQSAAEFADALAAHASGGKSATARLVTELFGEELRRQVNATVSAG